VDLRWRIPESRDLEACARLLEGHQAYPAKALRSMIGTWRQLMRERAIKLAVVEDLDRPRARRLAGFGGSVFVSDATMSAERRGSEPYLTMRTLLGEPRRGSAIQRLAEIRRGNSGDGLNLLVVHYAEANSLSPDERHATRFKMLEAFLADHRGYKIKEILQEYWGEIELPFVLNGWGHVRTDHAKYFEKRGTPLPPEQRPHLIGLTRKEAAAQPGSVLAALFVPARPRFAFRVGEQDVLQRALFGATDLELSRSLEIAMPTVKSRWKSIYARVAGVAPEVISDDDNDAVTLFESRRGKEKRRRLLEYLRHHPEELRPCLVTKAR
jgi:hypothetical protein